MGRCRRRVWRNHEHYRVGYDADMLHAQFSNIIAMRGCYWRNQGLKFRRRIMDNSNEEIISQFLELIAEVEPDIRGAVPKSYPEAEGIWVVARV